MKIKYPAYFEDEAAKIGAEVVERGMGGHHPFVRVRLGALTRKFTFPGTPSDHRALLNNKSQFRYFLRSMQQAVSKSEAAA